MAMCVVLHTGDGDFGPTALKIESATLWRRRTGKSEPPRNTKEHNVTIKDTGPKPQSFNLEQQTVDNPNYRTVAWSGRYLQLTLMSIPEGGDIGIMNHPDTDQFLRLDAGRGHVQMDPLGTTSTSTRRCQTGGASWCRQEPGTTSPTSVTNRCRCMPSMHLHTTSPARFRRPPPGGSGHQRRARKLAGTARISTRRPPLRTREQGPDLSYALLLRLSVDSLNRDSRTRCPAAHIVRSSGIPTPHTRSLTFS